MAGFNVKRDSKEVLFFDLQVLHDEDRVAHEAVFILMRKDKMLAEHFVSHFLDILDRVTDVNS